MTEKMSNLTDDAIYEIYCSINPLITLRLSSVSKSFRHILISNLLNIAQKQGIFDVRILPDLFFIPKTSFTLNKSIFKNNYRIFSMILTYIEPNLDSLRFAASNKNQQFLLDILQKQKFTAIDLLQVAAERNNVHLCKMSIQHVSNKNKYLLEASLNESNNVLKLIFRSYTVNKRIAYQALFNCVAMNNIEGARFLLFQAVKPKTDCLTQAVRRNNEEMITLLLDNGSKGVNQAAELAATIDHISILSLLLDHGITNRYMIRQIGYETRNPHVIDALER
jgi:hypothetical protein